MSVGGVGGGGVEIGESHPLLSSPVEAAEGLMGRDDFSERKQETQSHKTKYTL